IWPANERFMSDIGPLMALNELMVAILNLHQPTLIGHVAGQALFPLPSAERGSAIEAPIMLPRGNIEAFRRSISGRDVKCRVAALLLLAALPSATAIGQRPPQPVFTELFDYDPAAPSQLLGNWRISSQLDSKLQPLRVGVVEDSGGKTVGRVTVQEGDGLDGANEAMLRARRYVCDSEGSRAAEMEAEPSGVVPSERAEIQVRSDRGTGTGELVKFGQPVWYRFSFKIAGDWPQDVPAAGRQPCRTVIHQIKQDSFKEGKSCNASPFFKIEARPLASACASSRK